MVQMTVRLTATSGRAPQLIDALHSLMRHSRGHAGCLSASLAADVDEANTFSYQEDWRDEESIKEELRTDRFSQLLSLMETSVTPPVLEFRFVTETRGLEYVSAARARENA
jgi:quinol monooxygenase YgiN